MPYTPAPKVVGYAGPHCECTCSYTEKKKAERDGTFIFHARLLYNTGGPSESCKKCGERKWYIKIEQTPMGNYYIDKEGASL